MRYQGPTAAVMCGRDPQCWRMCLHLEGHGRRHDKDDWQDAAQDRRQWQRGEVRFTRAATAKCRPKQWRLRHARCRSQGLCTTSRSSCSLPLFVFPSIVVGPQLRTRAVAALLLCPRTLTVFTTPPPSLGHSRHRPRPCQAEVGKSGNWSHMCRLRVWVRLARVVVNRWQDMVGPVVVADSAPLGSFGSVSTMHCVSFGVQSRWASIERRREELSRGGGGGKRQSGLS